jgi:hypothetical protein
LCARRSRGDVNIVELLASYGYAFYPIAAYGLHTDDPFRNGVAAKPGHFGRFPALGAMAAAAVIELGPGGPDHSRVCSFVLSGHNSHSGLHDGEPLGQRNHPDV